MHKYTCIGFYVNLDPDNTEEWFALEANTPIIVNWEFFFLTLALFDMKVFWQTTIF